MKGSNSVVLKRAFLVNFLKCIQEGGLSSKSMTLQERKSAIKLSSDVALAAARRGRRWSSGLISKALEQERDCALLKAMVGGNSSQSKPTTTFYGSSTCKAMRSKKIIRSSKAHKIRRAAATTPSPQRLRAVLIAKKMVKRRTQVLKSLVPGGEAMDDCSLLDETLDYIISLKAQIDVMQALANNVGSSMHENK